MTRERRIASLLAVVLTASAGLRADPAEPPPPDVAKPGQRESQGPPPVAPGAMKFDPGAALPPLPPRARAPLIFRRVPASSQPELPASQFNPDPGAWAQPPLAPGVPFFSSDQIEAPMSAQDAPLSPLKAAPRGPLERPEFVPPPPAPLAKYGTDPVPSALQLPRYGVRENRFVPKDWEASEAPSSPPGTAASGGAAPEGAPAGAVPVPDRWHIGFVPWMRYTAGDTNEMPYGHADPEMWDYYRQSTLKGDLPIHGQDVFLRLTVTSDTVAEDRKLPTPSGASAASAGSFDNFGSSNSRLFVTDLGLSADLFKGATVFKPNEWVIHIRPVFDFNHVDFRNTGQVSPDPRGSLTAGIGSTTNNSGVVNPGDVGSLLGSGLAPASGSLAGSSYSGTSYTYRNKGFVSLQEAFVEKHLEDLSPNYDFCAIKIGNQTFNSDFRGFIFNDTNLGARFFGNYESNRYQYNLAVFDLREKDTNSGLNTFDRRGEIVAVANLYRQDTFAHGYTTEVNVLASFDQPSTHYDTNGNIVRPAPIGTVVAHRVDAYYVGYLGDGHLGSWNLTDAFYLVTGHDEFNGLAGRPTDILAGMAAIEVSYDHDWMRYKASFFYATGDRNTGNGKATGFDSIDDNTNFTGGPFSYWVRQGFNLGGTSVALKQRFSLLPDLRTSKTEGQANFVNPGLVLGGIGAEADVTPKLKAFANANYLRFASTDTIETVLVSNRAPPEIGFDLSGGVQWRPFLINNVILSAGCGVLLPGRGYRDIYANTEPNVPGFTSSTSASQDSFLYSFVAAVTLTY